MKPDPPRLARLLLSRLAKREHEFVLGDLQEEFTRRAASNPRAARRWYWVQVMRSLRHARLGGFGTTTRPRPASGLRLEPILFDVRYALRGVRRAPGFWAVAVFTLAMGLGANATIFTVIDHIVFRGLPFPNEERIVSLAHFHLDGSDGEWNPSFPDYLDYANGLSAVRDLAAWRHLPSRLAPLDGQDALRVHAVGVTWNFLRIFGTAPVAGRLFTLGDEATGAPRVAVLSQPFWQSRFGARSSVMGQVIRLDDVPYEIVGVAPLFGAPAAGGVLPSSGTEIWLPYRNSAAAEGMTVRGLANVNVVGLLDPGIDIDVANMDLAIVAARLADQFPDSKTGESAGFAPVKEAIVAANRPTLFLTFGAVSLVFLIACSNVTSLLLARGETRRREIALRSALGAARVRVVRQLVTESLVIATLGGIGAAALATLGVRFVQTFAPPGIPRIDAATVDARILLVLVAASLLVGVAVGLVPAFRATNGDPSPQLRGTSMGLDRQTTWIRSALVIGEMALATALVVGALTLVSNLKRTLDIDPGFDPERLLVAYVQLPMPFVSDDWSKAVVFFRDLEQRVGAIPGVESVASAYQHPASPGWSNAFGFVGATDPDHQKAQAIFRPVTPGYFETARIQLHRGRTFTRSDDEAALGVVIVNEAFLRRYLAEVADPLGTVLDYGDFWGARPRNYEIVGVVADVKFDGRVAATQPAVYFPHAQQPVREMNLLVRAAGDPLALVPSIRAAVADLDPSQPVDNVATMRSLLAHSVGPTKFLTMLFTIFAATALSVAAVGIYGVLSFTVGKRSRDIGIRMALGAARSSVRRLVIGQGLAFAVVGGGIGLGVALAGTRLMSATVFGVEPAHLPTYAAAVFVLLVAAVLACYLPARRASRVDPLLAIRADG